MRERCSRLAGIFVASLLLVACSTPPRAQQASPARPLLAPQALGKELAAVQVVRGAFGEHDAMLQCAVSARTQETTLVGLTSLGMRLFSVTYDGAQIRYEKARAVPALLTPERLLADLQLVYWPLAALQSRLRTDGWDVTEPFAGTRRLHRSGQLVAEVHYAGDDPWRGRAWLVDLQHAYTLTIDSQIQ